MRIFMIFCCLMVLYSCSSHRTNTEHTDYSRLVSGLRETASGYERQVRAYRDSIVMMKGLMEKSVNVVDSVSHLETSYARSEAAVRDGKLHHSIENKDSVPARVRFIFVRVEKRDTLRVEKADTVYREKSAKTRTVKENKPMFGTFFYTSGWIAWILVIVGSGIWFRYKVKKGEK